MSEDKEANYRTYKGQVTSKGIARNNLSFSIFNMRIFPDEKLIKIFCTSKEYGKIISNILEDTGISHQYNEKVIDIIYPLSIYQEHTQGKDDASLCFIAGILASNGHLHLASANHIINMDHQSMGLNPFESGFARLTYTNEHPVITFAPFYPILKMEESRFFDLGTHTDKNSVKVPILSSAKEVIKLVQEKLGKQAKIIVGEDITLLIIDGEMEDTTKLLADNGLIPTSVNTKIQDMTQQQKNALKQLKLNVIPLVRDNRK